MALAYHPRRLGAVRSLALESGQIMCSLHTVKKWVDKASGERDSERTLRPKCPATSFRRRADMRSRIHAFTVVVSLLALCVAHSAGAEDSFSRKDVSFKSAGLNLVGWLYVPDGLKTGEKRPAIVMAHGWSAVKEMYLDAFAAKFARGGFVVTVFDYRNF